METEKGGEKELKKSESGRRHKDGKGEREAKKQRR